MKYISTIILIEYLFVQMIKKRLVREIAKERVSILIATALLEIREGNDKLADDYARLAKIIAMRLRLRLPYEIRGSFTAKGASNSFLRAKMQE